MKNQDRFKYASRVCEVEEGPDGGVYVLEYGLEGRMFKYGQLYRSDIK